jgi:hypothetical protein
MPDEGLREKIEIVNAAVGSHRRTVRFDAAGATRASVKEAGAIQVNCVTLDKELAGEASSFLKYDVEGTELDALIGAQDIKGCLRPIVAVSVYHRPEDLWQIPLYLQSLNPGYHFSLRSHDEEGRDLVSYVIPSSRFFYLTTRRKK